MLYRVMLIFVLLLAVPAAAADDEFPLPEEPAGPVVVQDVQVVVDADGSLLLSIEAYQVDGCDFPLTVEIHQEGQVVYVELVRDETAPDTMCTSVIFPFTLEVTVELLFDADEPLQGDMLVLVVENFLAGLALEADDDGGLPHVAPGAELMPLMRNHVVVETLTVRPGVDKEEGPVAVVSGYYATGCRGPLVTVLRHDEAAMRLEVELYQAMPLAVICPAILMFYEGEVALPAGLQGFYTVAVNGQEVLYDMEGGVVVDDAAMGETFPVYHVIESADMQVLESFPMQLNLIVQGYQSDGCMVPVVVEQRREENTVYVEIYRRMSPAMMCPMMIVGYSETIALEGGFTPGSYTIHINDLVLEIDL